MYKTSLLLQDNFELLNRYTVGKSIKSILDVKENKVAFLLDDGTIISFLQFEDELIFDIELPIQV